MKKCHPLDLEQAVPVIDVTMPAASNLVSVIVVGRDVDGNLYVAASHADHQETALELANAIRQMNALVIH